MIFTEKIKLQTKGFTDIIDITESVNACLAKSGMERGVVTVFVVGSTGAVSTIEYEPGLKEDLKEALEKIAPQGKEYHHDKAWGDGNGYAHIRATLMGPSLAIPFENQALCLGTWQQIIFVDFDNRARSRTVLVSFVG